MTEKQPPWDDTAAVKQATAWLDEHWPQERVCPICRSNQWSVGGVGEVRSFSGGPLDMAGTIYPLVIVTCEVCGYTWFLNGLVSGAIGTAGTSGPS